MTTPAEEAWAVYGVELPEAFIFPVTRLGLTADVHGAGSFVGKAPLRVDCHVHFDAARLEILSSLNPHTGAELAVGTEFEEQFSLALWLYNSAPCGIVPMPSGGRSTHTFRRALALGGRDTMANTSKTWSLRERALEDFLRFAQTLFDFHEDRQAYFVARVTPDVLKDNDVKSLFVSGHDINAKWLAARGPMMAAADLYERARLTPAADIAFLLLMMSLEVLFNDGGTELARRLGQRCAFLNGRDASERSSIFESFARLYDRRSRLVHSGLFEKGRVRGSVFNPRDADHLQAEIRSFWDNRGVNGEAILALRSIPSA